MQPRGVAAYIRRHRESYEAHPVVAATVHEDIASWLNPDWIWDAKRGVLLAFEKQTEPEIVTHVTVDDAKEPAAAKKAGVFDTAEE